MAHIDVPAGIPGIRSLFNAYPATAEPLLTLAQTLLVHETETFSKAERETLASYVSYLNGCIFCSESHAAAADVHWKEKGFSKRVWQNFNAAPLSDRFRALLAIAAKVQKNAREVSPEDIANARKLGATEKDVHDAVLIAAAFCMYNRYVDGLGALTPERGSEVYHQIGERLAHQGYRVN